MASVENISIALTADMVSVVRKAVESGEYLSSSEVVYDALNDWKIKREKSQNQVEELRRLWHEGINSGPGRFTGIEDLVKEARQRFAAGYY